MDMVDVELWVVVDEAGNYSVGNDAEAAAEKYSDDIGDGDGTAKRLVKVILKLPTPKPITLTGKVPAEAGAEACELSVA